MHELLPIIRRARRPLVEPEPAPVAVVPPAPPQAEPLPPVVVENPKPKKSREDAAKN